MIDLSVRQLIDAQDQGASAESILKAHLEAIRAGDKSVHAFLHVDEAGARAQARRVDLKRPSGQPLGLLAGVPVAVKDSINTADMPTTAGSKILAGFRPPEDAHVVAALRQADAVIVGKTNLDEFAMGSSTEHRAFGPTRNPWDRERTPGGSSGGSAAAVTARFVPLALGSDTGGSIRQPAAFCGIVGLKPTYGRVSRRGLIAFANSLDQIGPMARSVADTALLAEVLATHDPLDSTCVDRPTPPYAEQLEIPVRPLTIGVLEDQFTGLDGEIESALRATIAVFQSLSATIRAVNVPHDRFAVAAYYLVATAEASSNLARYDGVQFGFRAERYANLLEMVSRTRAEGFGAEVKRRIMLGTFALSHGYKDAYYLKAMQVRRLIQADYLAAFQNCDIILGPTTPTPAFRLGEKLADPLAMYLSDACTIAANLTGIPALSLPCGFSKAGLPIGMQLQAPAFEELKLLRVARMYEHEVNMGARSASKGN